MSTPNLRLHRQTRKTSRRLSPFPGPQETTSSTTVATDRAQADADEAKFRQTSPDLIAQIESTLDRMQGNLSDFRDQLRDSFQFDAGDDDDLPPSAA